MTRKILIAALFGFASVPLLAFGEAITVSNSGSISSHTSASASTGGNSVGSGGSVTTGNASASAHSETSVDGQDGNSSVEIRVETEANGVKKSETIKRELKAGESVSIKVATSSTSGGQKNGRSAAAAAVAVSASASSNTDATTTDETGENEAEIGVFGSSTVGKIIESVVDTILNIVGALWFW